MKKYIVIEEIHGLDGESFYQVHHEYETIEDAETHCIRFNQNREDAGRSGQFYVKEKK